MSRQAAPQCVLRNGVYKSGINRFVLTNTVAQPQRCNASFYISFYHADSCFTAGKRLYIRRMVPCLHWTTCGWKYPYGQFTNPMPVLHDTTYVESGSRPEYRVSLVSMICRKSYGVD